MDLSRSTLKLFVSRSGNAVVFFAGITAFSRWLSPDAMGVFFLYLALLGVLSIPADAGIRGALEKRMSEGRNASQLLGSALAFKLVALAVVGVGVLLARGPVDEYVGTPIATLLAVGLVVQEFARFYVQAVRGELRVGTTAPIQFSRRVVMFSLGAVLVWFGFGVRGLLLGQICGRAVEFLWAAVACDTSVGRPTVAHLHSLLSFSKYQSVLGVGGRIYQWSDTLIVGFFLAQQYVSAYEIAWQITLLVLLGSKSIGLTLFPQISRWDDRAQDDRIASAVSNALSFALLLSVPAVVGAVLYGRAILRYVYGPGYTIAASVLVVLMVEKLFQSVNDVVGAAVRAIDRPDLAARATVVSVGLNLVWSPVLVTGMGFLGAAVATAAAWVVNTALHLHYLSEHVSFSIPYRILAWYGLAAVGMGALLTLLQRVVPVAGLPTLLAHVAVGAAAYAAILAGVPTVRARIIAPGLRQLSP
ncbi:MAG: oligosaccharide flippase family protein [Haloarculaceae archaeon]